MTVEDFARTEYREHIIYTRLASIEKNGRFKRVLQELAQHEHGHYLFWASLAKQQKYEVKRRDLVRITLLRKVLGLTFVARLLERNEHSAIEHYTEFLKAVDDTVRPRLEQIIEHEKHHESSLIEQIKEEKVAFTGSIMLGMSDGLIELTGALVGFSFAFSNSLVVAMSGLITGISASMSMAASAYMQEKHETDGKDPKKSAFYTGVSYIIVVALMVFPFFLPVSIFTSLTITLLIVVLIVAAVSYYTAVIFNRVFKKQFGEIFFFSVGVALVAFLIGTLFRYITGIEL